MEGVRVDKALTELLVEHSRGTIQQWIKQGLVLVDGEITKQKLKLCGTEILEFTVPSAHSPANGPPKTLTWTSLMKMTI